jgi:nucleotide-binding universal stress UspA family protein
VETRQHAVVAGVDGSRASREAARFAAAEAAARGVPLHLVHVVPWPNPGAAATRLADRTWADELRRIGRAVLEEASADAATLLPPGRVSGSVEFGDPVAELCRAAAGAAVLVVGARGVGGLTGLVIGSTATAAAAYARCPVVVLPADLVVPDRQQGPVVTGVAGCGRDDAVLSFAFPEAALRRTELVAVHTWRQEVTDPSFPTIRPLVADAADEADDQRRLLAEALAGHRDKEPDVVVREVVARDRPARALVEASWDAQLLVVGRSHRHPLGRIASPTHAVLHRAGCPVAVVPTSEPTGDGRP